LRTIFLKLFIVWAFFTATTMAWSQMFPTAQDYMQIAEGALRDNDINGAVQDYIQAIKLNPKNWQAYQNLGSCYVMLGKLEEAKMAYQESLAINPDNPAILKYTEQIGVKMSPGGAIENPKSAPPSAPSIPKGQLSLGISYDVWDSSDILPFNGYEIFSPVSFSYQLIPSIKLYAQTEYACGSYTDSASNTETINLTNFSDTVAGGKFNFKLFGLPSLLNIAVNIPTGDPSWESQEFASSIPTEFEDGRYQGRGFGMSAFYALSIPGLKDEFGVAAGYLYAQAFNPNYAKSYGMNSSLSLGDAAFLAFDHVQHDSENLSEIARLSVYYSLPTVLDGNNIFQLGTNFSASYAWSNPKGFSLELGAQAYLPCLRLNEQNQFVVEDQSSYAPRFYATASYAFGDFVITGKGKYIMANNYTTADQYYDGGGFVAGIGPAYSLKIDGSSDLKFSTSFDYVYAFNFAAPLFDPSARYDQTFGLFTVSTSYELKL
jgi:tetratricopeptide (TPR) repeat protein